jgi:hypothetical protein
MKNRSVKMIIAVIAVMLFITAVAKMFALSGSAPLLAVEDPVLGVRFSILLFASAVLEVVVGAICLRRPVVDGLSAILWLSSIILSYRVCLWWAGWTKPCGCLGNVTDALHISPLLADNLMKGLLSFMFIGSLSLLVLNRRERGTKATADSAGTGCEGESISSI